MRKFFAYFDKERSISFLSYCGAAVLICNLALALITAALLPRESLSTIFGTSYGILPFYVITCFNCLLIGSLIGIFLKKKDTFALMSGLMISSANFEFLSSRSPSRGAMFWVPEVFGLIIIIVMMFYFRSQKKDEQKLNIIEMDGEI